GETLDRPKRGAQVVRDAVSKGVEFVHTLRQLRLLGRYSLFQLLTQALGIGGLLRRAQPGLMQAPTQPGHAENGDGADEKSYPTHRFIVSWGKIGRESSKHQAPETPQA